MIDDQIQALYAALKAMRPMDLTEQQFELLCVLDNILGV